MISKEKEYLASIFAKARYIKITNEARRDLSKPYKGILSTKQFIERAKENVNNMVTVGDVVTNTMISNGILPKMVIFDLKTRRKKIKNNEATKRYSNLIEVENPAGMISKGLYLAIIKNINKKHTAIKVDGEEDLAVLITVILSKNGDIISWGVPGKGVNLLKVNNSERKNAVNIIKKMRIIT